MKFNIIWSNFAEEKIKKNNHDKTNNINSLHRIFGFITT